MWFYKYIYVYVYKKANFAKWEPWHGKFGFSHPWEKYLEIGEVLRELAAIIISLQTCIQSTRQVKITSFLIKTKQKKKKATFFLYIYCN